MLRWMFGGILPLALFRVGLFVLLFLLFLFLLLLVVLLGAGVEGQSQRRGDQRYDKFLQFIKSGKYGFHSFLSRIVDKKTALRTGGGGSVYERKRGIPEA